MKLIDIFERVAPFDVSFVKTLIYDNYDEIIDAKNKAELQKTLNRVFADHKIRFVILPTVKSNAETRMQNLGVWEGRISNDGRIAFVLTDNVQQSLANDDTRDAVIQYLTSLTAHELAHRHQTNASNGKAFFQQPTTKTQKIKDEWVKYLNDPHEMNAMAYEIIQQLKQNRVTNENAIKSLQTSVPHVVIKNSERFASVFDTLRNDDNQQVVQRIKKSIVQILTSGQS